MKIRPEIISMLFGLLTVASLLSCKKAETIQPPGILIDVRSTEEFSAGHLKGAINIPYTEIGEKIAGLVADKNSEVIVYCRSGRRSGIAKETLDGMGYTKVINAGGYEALKKKYGTE